MDKIDSAKDDMPSQVVHKPIFLYTNLVHCETPPDRFLLYNSVFYCYFLPRFLVLLKNESTGTVSVDSQESIQLLHCLKKLKKVSIRSSEVALNEARERLFARFNCRFSDVRVKI